MTLPKRPIATCVVSDSLKGAIRLLDQYVIERQEKLTVGGRPVVGLARNDEDVPVQAQLLPVVLADVRVVPVRTRVGKAHLIGEGLADRDRRLRLVGAVVAVLEPQAVPVHGRIHVAAIRDVHCDRRVLRGLQGWAWNRAVVGEHAHGGIADLLLDRCDLELELVSVRELDDLRPSGVGQSFGRARQLGGVRVPFGAVMVMHPYSPSFARASAAAPISGGASADCVTPRFFASCEVSIRSAMNSASSFTQPISAEPRVCCQVRPKK